MARPYSVRFLSRYGPSSTTSYQVPAGFRAVVRFCGGVNYSGNIATVMLAVGGGTAWFKSLPAETSGFAEEMRLVAYQGEYIYTTTNGSDVRLQVSGFLFVDNLVAGAGELAPPDSPPAAPDRVPPAGL